MKFMKIGSKPDSFQTVADNSRYVSNELASDVIMKVADIKFHLHKFPLLAKCACLRTRVGNTHGETPDEVDISDIPGGSGAFELCAKFCYGITVTLNPYNVVAARCAAEYLGMHESIEKGNLICKIDIFLSSSIFRSWKDSIIVLQTAELYLPLSEELKITRNCIDVVATKACSAASKVDWSYTYNQKKLPEENGNGPNLNGLSNRPVPKDWWIEDLCELEINLYKEVVTKIIDKAILPNDVIGEALKAYAYKKLPGLSKGIIPSGEAVKYRPIVDTIVGLLPAERGSLSSRFLLKLLKAAKYVDSKETEVHLIRRIGQQLEEASVQDLLIRAGEGENMIYDVETMKNLVKQFLTQDGDSEAEFSGQEIQEIGKPGILSDASKLMVAKLIDRYLAEIAKDPNLPFLMFMELAQMVSGFPRPTHDALYRAVDMYLKEHPGISKSERKRICKLIDCKKLSVDACMHVVQNERLPLRVVVQVLFFEQVRLGASSGSSTPDLHRSIRDLNNGSQRSSLSAASNAEEDWDAVATAEELKALKEEIAALRLSNRDRNGGEARISVDKAVSNRIRGLLKSKKVFLKLWSRKGEKGENSGSDSSESLVEEAKLTPSRNTRHSVS